MTTSPKSAGPSITGTNAAAVDVWKVQLDETCYSLELLQTLSRGEMRTASNFTSGAARRRYIVCRIQLRRILARYCRVASAYVPIRRGRWGKPYLGAPFTDIHFNVSHSKGMAVVAVTRGAALGIDVEHRQKRELEAIAADWLHDGERRELLCRDQSEREAAFFRLWCRKEAVMKADGRGLRVPLYQFCVSSEERHESFVKWPTSTGQWHLYNLAVDEPYVGALALDRPASSIEYRELV